MILSVKDVANRLGVNVNTVKRIHPKDLPYFRVTNRGDRRYYEADVDKYISIRTVGK